MGGRSSSSSSSSNSTSTQNTDNRVAVESGGIGVGANAVVDVELTDLGVVDGTADVLNNALSGLGEVVNKVTDEFGGIVKDNQETLREQLEGDTKEVAELGLKTMAIIAVAAVAFIFFGKGKR